MEKIILFGDSITAGYMDGAITKILPELVTSDLHDLGFSQFEVIDAGIPGETSRDGLKRLDAHVLKYDPTFVTVFWGANDVAEHNLVPLDEYRTNLATMIEKIGKDKVILITPPYINQQQHALDRPQARIEAYVQCVLALGKETGVPVIDLYEAMDHYPGRNEFLQADGLHFSQEGYELLAALIAKFIKLKLTT